MQTEVRKLPKKTVFTIALIIIIAIAIFFVLKFTKEQKLTEMLATIGHNNIKSVEVINKLSVEDTETRYKRSVFKIKFYDNDLNQSCIGFIHRGKNQSYSKDFNCK